MVAVRIEGHTTYSNVVDNYSNIGVYACECEAVCRVKDDVVLVATLHAVDLNGCIIKPDTAGTTASLRCVVVAKGNGTGRTCRRAEADLAVIVGGCNGSLVGRS